MPATQIYTIDSCNPEMDSVKQFGIYVENADL